MPVQADAVPIWRNNIYINTSIIISISVTPLDVSTKLCICNLHFCNCIDEVSVPEAVNLSVVVNGHKKMKKNKKNKKKVINEETQYSTGIRKKGRSISRKDLYFIDYF